jgi:hypothetical protein
MAEPKDEDSGEICNYIVEGVSMRSSNDHGDPSKAVSPIVLVNECLESTISAVKIDLHKRNLGCDEDEQSGGIEEVESEKTEIINVTKRDTVNYKNRSTPALMLSEDLHRLLLKSFQAKADWDTALAAFSRVKSPHFNPLRAARTVHKDATDSLNVAMKEIFEYDGGASHIMLNDLQAKQVTCWRAACKKTRLQKEYDTLCDTNKTYIALKEREDATEELYMDLRWRCWDMIEDSCATENTAGYEHKVVPVIDNETETKLPESRPKETTTEDVVECQCEKRNHSETAARLEAAEWLLNTQRARLHNAKKRLYDFRENQYEEARRQFAVDSGQSLQEDGVELDTMFGPVFLSKCMDLTKKIIDEEKRVKTYSKGVRDLGGVDDDQESNFGDPDFCGDDETEQEEEKEDVDRSYIVEWRSRVTNNPMKTPTREAGEGVDRISVAECEETVGASEDTNDQENDRHSQSESNSTPGGETDPTSTLATLQLTGQDSSKVHTIGSAVQDSHIGPSRQQVASAPVTPHLEPHMEKVSLDAEEEQMSDYSAQSSKEAEGSVRPNKIPTIDITGKETRIRKAGTEECADDDEFYLESRQKRLGAWAQAVRKGYA